LFALAYEAVKAGKSGQVHNIRADRYGLEGGSVAQISYRSVAGCATGTFRKRSQDPQHWAEKNVGDWNANTIAGLLGHNGTVFIAQLAQIEALQAAIGHAPTVLGNLTQIYVSPPS
jgi:hypothetical protein